MNHVTPATAIALKEAGFPQPSPMFGQIWYDLGAKQILIIAHNVGKSGRSGWSDGVSTGLYENEFVPGGIFAPTAVELLESLPPKTLAGFNNGEWSVMPAGTEIVFTHRNLAEAAAMAWMAINKKQTDFEN